MIQLAGLMTRVAARHRFTIVNCRKNEHFLRTANSGENLSFPVWAAYQLSIPAWAAYQFWRGLLLYEYEYVGNG